MKLRELGALRFEWFVKCTWYVFNVLQSNLAGNSSSDTELWVPEAGGHRSRDNSRCGKKATGGGR